MFKSFWFLCFWFKGINVKSHHGTIVLSRSVTELRSLRCAELAEVSVSRRVEGKVSIAYGVSGFLVSRFYGCAVSSLTFLIQSSGTDAVCVHSIFTLNNTLNHISSGSFNITFCGNLNRRYFMVRFSLLHMFS